MLHSSGKCEVCSPFYLSFPPISTHESRIIIYPGKGIREFWKLFPQGPTKSQNFPKPFVSSWLAKKSGQEMIISFPKILVFLVLLHSYSSGNIYVHRCIWASRKIRNHNIGLNYKYILWNQNIWEKIWNQFMVSDFPKSSNTPMDINVSRWIRMQ